jgi:DNA-binding winged helix-turn-helix (wHTH) protein/tetratricopeptide (TPR) repeat protein
LLTQPVKTEHSPEPFLLGGHRVDPEANRIRVGSHVHRLEGKVMAVLCELAREPGHVVASEYLLTTVWRDTHVTNSVLGRAVHLLRKTLGDDALRPRFIETIPRRGFRLIAPVGPLLPELQTAAPDTGDPDRLYPTPLVGREHERAELERLMDRAAAGTSTLALLSGEPGVGKTRLAQDLLRKARDRGFVALQGHCLESQGAPPYNPWVEILATTARITPPQMLRDLLGDGAPEVARLLPELRQMCPGLAAPLDLPPAEQRRYLYRCVQALVERSSRTRPQLLILEDLHWADEATVLLLEHLALHLRAAPVLLLATYRDIEVPAEAPLAGMLESQLRERLMHHLPLDRLGRSGVAEMLEARAGKPPPAALVATFHGETEGNPFFVEEVYHHLEEDGRLFDEQGRWHEELEIDEAQVPENIRRVLERRLGRLESQSRSLLTLAAVIGRSFAYEVLRAATPLHPRDAVRVLESAQRSGLVEVDPHARGRETALRFRHELFRQSLLASAGPLRRGRMHLRAADAIEQLAGDQPQQSVAALAHHLYLAGVEADPARTFTYLMAAGERALQAAAFAEALVCFERAKSLAAPRSDAERARLFWKRGRAQRGLGQWLAAESDWDRSLRLYEQVGDRQAIASVTRSLTHLFIWSGRGEQAAALSRRGLDHVGEQASSQRCALLVVNGWARASGATLEQAVEMARQLGDARAHGQAMVASAHTHLLRLGGREAHEAAHRGIELLQRVGDLWNLADALAYFRLTAVATGRPGVAAPCSHDVLELAQAVGHHGAEINALRAQGLGEWLRTGDVSGLESFARHSLATCEEAMPVLSPLYRSLLAQADFWRGRWREAGERSAPLATLDMGRAHTGHTWGVHFLVQCHLGREQDAMAMYGAKRADLPESGARRWTGAWDALFAAIEGLAQLGRSSEAAELYPLAIEALATGTVVSHEGRRLLQTTAGLAAAASGRWPEADDHFGTALHQATTIPFRSEQAEVRRLWAKVLLEGGRAKDRARALQLLEEAITMYEDLAMPGHVAMTEALLAT